MPRVCSISRLPLIALLLAAFGSVAWAKPKVAILGLEVSNSGVVDPKDAGNAAKLTEELRRNPGPKFDLAPNSNRELQDEKVMGNCDTEKPSCMAPIGNGLNAEYLVYGRIEKASEKGKDGYKVLIKLLNVKDRKVEESWEGFVPLSQIGSGSLRDWSQKVNARLAGEKPPLIPDRVEKGPGKLVVKIGNTKTGKVSIDGARKGELEDGTITLSLSEGAHRLEIEAPDRKPYEDTVVITSGQTKTVDVELEETVGQPPPPPPPGRGNRTALKVAGIGLGLVGVAAGSYVLYLTVGGPERDYEALALPPIVGMDMGNVVRKKLVSKDCGTPEGTTARTGDDRGDPSNAAFDQACKANSRRNIVGAIGIASGVLAAGALYFAYIHGGGASNEKQAGYRRKRRELTVTPVISPSGGGATVRFDW